MMREIASAAYKLHTTGKFDREEVEGILPSSLVVEDALRTFAMFHGFESAPSRYDEMVRTAMDGRECGSTVIWKMLTFEYPSCYDTAVHDKVNAMYHKYPWDLLTRENIHYGSVSGIAKEDLEVLREFYKLHEKRHYSLTACAYDYVFGQGVEVDHALCAHYCCINSFDEYSEIMHGICLFWDRPGPVCCGGFNWAHGFEALCEGRVDVALKYCPNKLVLEKFARTYIDASDFENYVTGHNFVPTRYKKAFKNLKEMSWAVPFFNLTPTSEDRGLAPCTIWAIEDYFKPKTMRQALFACANALIAGRDYEIPESDERTVSDHDFMQIAKSLAFERMDNDCMMGNMAIRLFDLGHAEAGLNHWQKLQLDDAQGSYYFLTKHLQQGALVQ